mmetsp:Transcript_7312/g.22612  ORF Transcript_7312/g.22612 Transcript_7312/m.22612 type:complete len:251 (-) Transcript_7312:1007-1759(-)
MDSGAWKAARERSKRSRCDNVLALSRSGPPRLRSDGIVRMKKPPSPGMNSTLTPMHASLTIVFSEPLALTSRSLTLPPERRMTRSPWLSSRSLSNLHSPCCTHSRSIRGTSEARLTTPFVVAICGLPTAPSGPKGVTRTEISHLRSLAVTLYSGPSHFFRGVPARNHVYVRDVPGLATLVTTFSVCDTTASPVSSSRTISGASLVPVRVCKAPSDALRAERAGPAWPLPTASRFAVCIGGYATLPSDARR